MKTFKTQTVLFVFSLIEDFCFCSCYNNVNYDAWHVCKPLFGFSVATSVLVPKFNKPKKKAREKSGKWLKA